MVDPVTFERHSKAAQESYTAKKDLPDYRQELDSGEPLYFVVSEKIGGLRFIFTYGMAVDRNANRVSLLGPQRISNAWGIEYDPIMDHMQTD